MTVGLDALVLPAFDDLAGLPSEAAPWHETYTLDRSLAVRGLSRPVAHDGRVGVVPTGVGKTAAATTVTALLSSPALSLTGALVLSVGVAGAPPAVPRGSVVVADAVLDWDDKCRFDADASDRDPPLALNPYTGDRGIFHLDAARARRARSLADGVDLRDPGLGDEAPTVLGGVNVCGDELWHGAAMADQIEWLCSRRNLGPYRVTEMEDAGTAFALSRFDRLDRYLTVRGVSNHDRPTRGVDPVESFFDSQFEAGFGPAAENAASVAQAVVAAHTADD